MLPNGCWGNVYEKSRRRVGRLPGFGGSESPQHARNQGDFGLNRFLLALCLSLALPQPITLRVEGRLELVEEASGHAAVALVRFHGKRSHRAGQSDAPTRAPLPLDLPPLLTRDPKQGTAGPGLDHRPGALH